MLNRIQKAIIDFRKETGREPKHLYLGVTEYSTLKDDLEKINQKLRTSIFGLELELVRTVNAFKVD